MVDAEKTSCTRMAHQNHTGNVLQPSSKVRVESSYSDSFGVNVGVHQGSVLSPLLFIIILEALSQEFCTGHPWEILYADDLVIITESLEEIPTNNFRSIMRSETRLTKTFSTRFPANKIPTPSIPSWFPIQNSLYLSFLPSMILADAPRQRISWMQQRSTRRRDGFSTTSQGLPLIVPTFNVPSLNFNIDFNLPEGLSPCWSVLRLRVRLDMSIAVRTNTK